MQTIDIAGSLNVLGSEWKLCGPITTGTEECWDAVIWLDSRNKPSWSELVAAQTEHTSNINRIKRNYLLSSTDVKALPDYPHADDAARQLWLDYRQALRDLPDTDGWPSDITWPSEPE